MAATCESKIGCGIFFAMFQTISMSWRAAWNTLTTFSSVISANRGARSMPGASASTTTASSGLAILRHAEQGIIGGLAQELGVDGDEGMPRHARANLGQFLGGGDQIHGCGQPN